MRKHTIALAALATLASTLPAAAHADLAFYSAPVSGKALGKSSVVLGAKVNF